MQDIVVSTIQSSLQWENIPSNLHHFEQEIETLKKTDLIVLPEMFNTGFSMNAAELAENPGGKTMEWMSRIAGRKNALIIGSIITKENGRYYNRLLIARPDGQTQHYDKRHLFRMAKEDKTFSYGAERVIVEWRGWKILPLVCYDLRFPVWSRNIADKSTYAYDLLVFIANWPSARVLAWDTLLKARAIENLAYCAGVNRIGEDGNGVAYNGHTGIYSPKGETLYFSENAASASTSLSGEALKTYREKFPANLDADSFTIKE